MKKKMLFMAAIAGLVTLGSCVKDDVSGSVEAVRNAKAQELLGIANEKNANAEHTRALQAADVAVQQATAAAQAATAKAQELRNEVTAAALQQEIAKTIAGYEEDLAKAKANSQIELNNLAAAVRKAATDNAADVATAVGNFNAAMTAFTAAQKAVIKDQLALAAAKNDAEHAAAIKENQINAQEKIIAEKEKLIELLTDLKAKISEGATSEELNAEAQALLTEANIAAKEFENCKEIDALIAAGEAWVAAYGQLFAFTADKAAGDPIDGKFAKVNNYFLTGDGSKGPNAVGMNLYTTYGTPQDIKAGDVNFGEVDGYTYSGGASYADGGAGVAKVSYSNYRLSEEAKLLVDKYVAGFTKGDNDALKAAKTAKADLEGQLGKSSDKKDTKFKDSKGNEATTLYANLAAAKEADDKAKDALDKANANLTGKPAAVEAAYNKLLAVAKAKTFKGTDWIDAVVGLADAMVDAYGEPAYDPNKKKFDFSKAADIKDAIDYLFGSTTHAGIATEADLDDEKEVEALFDSTDPNCLVKTWGKDAKKKDASEIKLVEDVINRDAKAKNVIKIADDAKKAKETTAKAVTAAQKAINDQPRKIANAQDAINAAQYDVDNSAKNLDGVKAMIEAVDLAKYEAAIKAAKEASDNFNKAADAVIAAQDVITDMYAEQGALVAAAISNPNDIDDQIKQAKEDIADAEQTIANWDNIPANNPDAIIAQAEADLADSMSKLVTATADLEAAKDALEALVGEIEIDLDGDDEPAEEPGEGEGEGDGEAPAETPEVVAPADGE